MMTMTTTRLPRLVDHLRKVLSRPSLKYDGLVRPFGPGVTREVQLEFDFRPKRRLHIP
jgi:hypothetical protein